MSFWIQTVLLCALTMGILILAAASVWRSKNSNRNLIITAGVLVLVFLARLFVGLFTCSPQDLGIENLGPVERFFDSMVHALQTFSMDEDYTGYLSAGKCALQAGGHPVWARVYGIVMSILNVCAPVLGGALLLEILSGIFPYIKIHLYPFRHKFIFSELNDMTMTLAEDLYKEENYRKFLKLSGKEKPPVFIFTDAYPDNTSEPRSELFERAGEIHAICVKTDLLHLPMRRSKSVSYFLMDRKTRDNVGAITKLLQKDGKGRYLWPVTEKEEDTEKKEGTEEKGREEERKEGKSGKNPDTRIYIFTSEDVENDLIWKAYKGMEEKDNHILIRPVRDYMNTAIRLMYDTPLFLPLIQEKEAEDAESEAAEGRKAKIKQAAEHLYVTIIGSGSLAEEVFKAAFWCGQIAGIQLHLAVLAEDADALRVRLEDKCPELLDSGLDEAAAAGTVNVNAGSGRLKVFPYDSSAPENPPYCMYRFRNIEHPDYCTAYPEDVLEKTDYYVIALGEDARNIEITGRIRRALARVDSCGHKGHIVLAPAVFDKELAALSRKKHPGAGEPYVLPFAELQSRFSYHNIMLESFMPGAEETGELYNAQSQEKMQEDEYTYWGNLIRSFHYPYKLFGLGKLDIRDLEIRDRDRFLVKAPYKVTEEENEMLAWVEHRRWNAFMRTQGFTCPTREQFTRYYSRHCRAGRPGLFKDVALRFHPCLVERSMGKSGYYDLKNRNAGVEDLTEEERRGLDCLDLVCLGHHIDYRQYDYKEFDGDLKRYLT